MATQSELHSLPPEVINCLKNARYLHLATSNELWPHVSLMNYTYLPQSPYPLAPLPNLSENEKNTSSGPLIIMTTHPDTRKMLNLQSNPRVSLLVHDWVSHRSRPSLLDPTIGITNPTMEEERQRQEQRRGGHESSFGHESSLAALLANLNSAEISSISATLNGYAHIIPQNTEEEEFYKRKHLENNQSCDGEGSGGGGDCYLIGEDVRVVVVRIDWARVSDWRGEVRNFDCMAGQAGSGANMELTNGA